MTKKKVGLVATLIASSLLMGGCTQIDNGVEAVDRYAQDKLASISVPFEWFKLDEQKAPEAPVWKSISPLDLPGTDETEKTLGVEMKRVAELEEELVNPVKMTGFLSRNRPAPVAFNGFAVEREEQDVLGKVLREVDAVPYQSVSSLTLTGIGKTATGETTLLVSLNAINDTEDFLLFPLKMTVGENGLIAHVEQTEKPSKASSTPTPLSEKSEWVEAVHGEFSHLWTEIKNFPGKEDWTSVKESDLSAWLLLSGIEEPEKSTKALFEWYEANEGNLKLAQVTGYVHTDEQASAITKYEISYPVKDSENVSTLTVHYDRGLNKITNIKPGSPFQDTSKGELR